MRVHEPTYVCWEIRLLTCYPREGEAIPALYPVLSRDRQHFRIVYSIETVERPKITQPDLFEPQKLCIVADELRTTALSPLS